MRNIHVTPEPVTLEGFQAVLKPSKFGYSLKAVVGEDLICLLYTSPSPRDIEESRMPSSA